ncbi:MAG: polyphosphate kinase 2 family protein [Bacteroidota bacterium]
MNSRKKFAITDPSEFKLKHIDPASTGNYSGEEEALEHMADDLKSLNKLQEVLFAESKHSVLIILQAMDASGKDGVIKHVMAGLNPQGTLVKSFKHPNDEEYAHDFFWRVNKSLPAKGQIGIFNRSYYENVLICRVHPELILDEHIPGYESVEQVDKKFWKKRFKQINAYEKTLSENGTTILKFFLHISPEEQRLRLLKRIDNPDKHWKFQFSDINERKYWKDYMNCYEDMIVHTSTELAPWYVIPADNKWFTRTTIASILEETLKKLEMKFPVSSEEENENLAKAKAMLEAEG